MVCLQDKLLLAEASAGSSELQPAPGVAGSVPTLRVARTIWQPLTSGLAWAPCLPLQVLLPLSACVWHTQP